MALRKEVKGFGVRWEEQYGYAQGVKFAAQCVDDDWLPLLRINDKRAFAMMDGQRSSRLWLTENACNGVYDIRNPSERIGGAFCGLVL